MFTLPSPHPNTTTYDAWVTRSVNHDTTSVMIQPTRVVKLTFAWAFNNAFTRFSWSGVMYWTAYTRAEYPP